MEGLEYIKKTFFELLCEQYNGIALPLPVSVLESNKKLKEHTEYKKVYCSVKKFHGCYLSQVDQRCVNTIADLRLRIPDGTLIKYIEVAHSIESTYAELYVYIYCLPRLKSAIEIIREKLDTGLIRGIGTYKIDSSEVILYCSKNETIIPLRKWDIDILFDRIDFGIEQIRYYAGYLYRRNRCKKAIITLILCLEQRITYDIIYKIGKLLLETRYDDEWDEQIKKRKRLKIV